MKIAQRTWSEAGGWQGGPSGADGAQLVLLFGGAKQISEARWLAELK